jgi:hypothetical protein
VHSTEFWPPTANGLASEQRNNANHMLPLSDYEFLNRARSLGHL